MPNVAEGAETAAARVVDLIPPAEGLVDPAQGGQGTAPMMHAGAERGAGVSGRYDSLSGHGAASHGSRALLPARGSGAPPLRHRPESKEPAYKDGGPVRLRDYWHSARRTRGSEQRPARLAGDEV